MTNTPIDLNTPEFTRNYINLADARLGAEVTFATDDYFAPKDRMLNSFPPIFVPDKYDEHGKWMDGWETRRKRTTGYDYAIVRLMRRGIIHGLNIDTTHFTGNYPPAASVEACDCVGEPDENTTWQEILPAMNLHPDQANYVPIDNPNGWTHIRLNIYPDGGIARLRVYGQPSINWSTFASDELIDLAAAENGATIVAANDQHFGLASNILMPNRAINMGDGWETRRRREPGNDWCIIKLARPGTIEKVEVDTDPFGGNYPDRYSLQATDIDVGTEQSVITQSMFWSTVLPEQKLLMRSRNFYSEEIIPMDNISYVRLNIIPDGGIARLRLWGRISL